MKNSDEADDVLVRRALDKIASAWQELFDRYQHRLHCYLKGRGLSAFDADDIAQSTWLIVIQNLHTYRFESAFFTWLCTIARNTHVSGRRSRYSRHYCRLSTVIAKSLVYAEEKEPDFTPKAQVAHLLARVPLSPDQRELLRRQFWQGQTMLQIAGEMGIPEGTVRSRLWRLRRILATS